MNSTMVVIVLVVAAVVILGALLMMSNRKRRSQKLREQFGPEYDRVVRKEGDPGKAEEVLAFRQKRLAKFKVRPLSSTDRSSFRYRWNEVQSRFVDDPIYQCFHCLGTGRCRSAQLRYKGAGRTMAARFVCHQCGEV